MYTALTFPGSYGVIMSVVWQTSHSVTTLDAPQRAVWHGPDRPGGPAERPDAPNKQGWMCQQGENIAAPPVRALGNLKVKVRDDEMTPDRWTTGLISNQEPNLGLNSSN